MVLLMARVAVDDKLVKHISDTIVEHFHPRRIILFGSRARGDARPDSDIDLLVEMESEKGFYQRVADIDLLFADRQFSLDLIVLTPDELRREQEFLGGVVRAAVREGRTLYAVQQ